MKFIKFFLCFAFVVAVKGDFEIPDHLKAHADLLHNFCVNEIGVDEGLIRESRNGYLPMDDKLACYIHCLFHKTHMVSVFSSANN